MNLQSTRFHAQFKGCKRNVTATQLPSEFKLPIVRGKVSESYLRWYILLSKPCVETILFSFRF